MALGMAGGGALQGVYGKGRAASPTNLIISSDVAQRVDLTAVLEHFEVDVGARRAARIANESERVTPGNRAANAHGNRLVVAIAGHQAIAMVDLDQVAIARLLASEGDHT